MAIAVDYIFSFDVVSVELVQSMEKFGLGYPVLQNALTNTLTVISDHVFSEEEKDKIIDATIKTYTGVVLDAIRVETVHFVRTENIRVVSDNELKEKENG